jgi:putative acetyltransferase
MTISIRRAEPTDYAAVHQIFSGPRAVAGTLQLPYPSVEMWRAGTALLHAALELADQWLNLLRVELEVYVDNEPALRLYRKSGFVIEGAMSRFAYRAGQYVDVYLMARFKPE